MLQATKSKTKAITYTALMTAVMAVCSWITIPFTIPFTMQTFGVVFTLKLLGGKLGTVSILLYLVLGAIGVPVFSGFSGGPGVLFGPTGGYIIGFLVSALVYMLLETLTQKTLGNIAVTALLLLTCYVFGTAWFVIVMAQKNSPVGVASALMTCVVPYILPDAVKLFFADRTAKRLKKLIHF